MFKSIFTLILLLSALLIAKGQTATFNSTVVASNVWSENPVIATSTQQNALAIYENYVFMTYYDTDRNLCVSRNSNYGVGDWLTVVLPHIYEKRQLSNGTFVYDNHNTPNIAISPNDKRVHLSFDLHAHDLRYIISDENAAIASDENFTVSLFSSTRNYLQSNQRKLTSVTYPRFFVGANNKLFIMYRVGGSGSGDTYFGEYKDDGFWFSPFKLVSRDGNYNGSTTRCAYFNDIQFANGRIHLTWVWRETPAASDNHDLMFAYSDDNGQTWKNSAGNSLALPINLDSPGLNVATIPTNTGLTNHNGCTVDGHGNVHVTHRITGAYKHYSGIRNGDQYTWSNVTIATFAGDRTKVYADKITDDLYFLVRHGSAIKMFTTPSNDELWNQWTEKTSISDSFITSGNSFMNATGDTLTTMAVSSGDRLQLIKWYLDTDSPDNGNIESDPENPAPVFSFDTDDDLEGFVVGSANETATVKDGAITLSWNADVNVPKITQSGLSINASDYPKVLIRFKNNNDEPIVTGGSTANCARFVPNTDVGNKFFNIFHTASDAEFFTYILDLGADPLKYSGTLTSFQLQAVRNTVAGSSIEVAEIRFIGADNTWSGTVSSAWDEPGNWSENSVPAGEIVTIPAVANQPIISIADATVADLTLENGAVLSVTNNTTLTVLSNIIISGGSGHVEVASGSSLVTYGSVEGAGHVFNRSTTFNDATGKYSSVGSPVSGASTSALGSLVYSYDESVAYTSNRFVEVTSQETMGRGDAYFSAYTGDVTFTGAPHTGNVSVPLAFDAGDGSNAGFNLVSNPYPAAIDYSRLVGGTNNPDIDGTIYLWDDGGSNSGQRTNADYITINAIGEASAGSGRNSDWNGYIGSAQGFFVKANKASGALNLNNEMKAVGKNTSSSYFRVSETSDIQSLKISLSNEEGVSNESLLGFLPDATEGFDRLYDAYKLDGLNGVKIYSLLDEKPMVIQGLPLAYESIIPLGISLENAGSYKLNLAYVKNWSEGQYIYLADRQLGKLINLEVAGQYTFSGVKGVDENRFGLIITKTKNVLAANGSRINSLDFQYDKNGITIFGYDMKAKRAQVSIMDLSGAVLLNKEVNNLDSKTKLDFRFESKRVYILSVVTKSHSKMVKVVFY